MTHSIEHGDCSQFAIHLRFYEDPEPISGQDSALSRSWGSIQLWAGGQNLCLHVEGNQSIDSCTWYLLPILEWFVEYWDPILHEEKFPIQHDRLNAWEALQQSKHFFLSRDDDLALSEEHNWQEWWKRHALLAARDGGVLPDIIIRRRQQLVEFSWGNTRIAGTPKNLIFSIPSGAIAIEATYVAEILYEAIQEAYSFLSAILPASPRIDTFQKKIASLHTTDRREYRLAWMTGLGIRYERMRERFQIVSERISNVSKDAHDKIFGTKTNNLLVPGTCQASLMFGSVSPALHDEDLLLLADKLVESFQTESPSPKFDHISSYAPLRMDESRAWEQGYELAEKLLDDLEELHNEQQYINLDVILDLLNIKVENIQLADRNIRGVAIASNKHQPTILVSTRNPRNNSTHGRRFTLAHELCHLLHDQEQGVHLAHVTGPWAPPEIEKRANAFAAMLLAPDRLVRNHIDNFNLSFSNLEDLFILSSTLQASPRAVLEHLRNRGFIAINQYEELDVELESRCYNQ